MNKSVKTFLGLAALAAAQAFAFENTDPEDLASLPKLNSLDEAIRISDVEFSQDLANQDIVVNYTLSGRPAYIRADVLTNGVSLGASSVTSFSGALTMKPSDIVQPGRRSFRWKARKDWRGHLVSNLQVEVQAFYTDDVASVFPYVVIDLSGGPSAASYPVTYLAGIPSGGWTDEYKTTKLVLRSIPAGSVTGYSALGRTGTAYTINLTKDYYIGVFECTQKQWELVQGPVSFWTDASCGPLYPAKSINYYAPYNASAPQTTLRGKTNGALWPESDAVDEGSFISNLRAKTGLKFDIPTEAQWEYAARAGTSTDFWFGNYDNSGWSAYDIAMWDYGCSAATYTLNGGKLREVGLTIPNPWGLYDMYGNVAEWCLDKYDPNASDAYYAGVSGTPDYKGGTTGDNRVARGGHINDALIPSFDRATDSPGASTVWASGLFGFRLVLNP